MDDQTVERIATILAANALACRRGMLDADTAHQVGMDFAYLLDIPLDLVETARRAAHASVYSTAGDVSIQDAVTLQYRAKCRVLSVFFAHNDAADREPTAARAMDVMRNVWRDVGAEWKAAGYDAADCLASYLAEVYPDHAIALESCGKLRAFARFVVSTVEPH